MPVTPTYSHQRFPIPGGQKPTTPKQTQLRVGIILSEMELSSLGKSRGEKSIRVVFTTPFCIQALFPMDRVTLVEELSFKNKSLPLDIQVCFKQALDLEALNSAGYCGPSCYYFGYDKSDKHVNVIGWGGYLEGNVSKSSKGKFL